jgi:DNA-binding MarR family transcriptional regulator
MNEIALGVKRSFHGFLRITRKPFASVGLTAARFDLLYAVRAGGRESRVVEGSVEMRQSTIRRCLGVTPTVVSRMVRSLEQLGLVVRRRETHRDRRQMRVILTTKGLQALKTACSMLLRSVQRFVYEVICYGRHRDPMARFMAMGALESYLQALREYLGDTATLRYPWGHPDD